MDSRTLLARLFVIATITATVAANLQIATYLARRAWQFIRFLSRAPWWTGYVLAGLFAALTWGPTAYVIIAGPPRPNSAGGLCFIADTCLLTLGVVAWAAYILPQAAWWPGSWRPGAVGEPARREPELPPRS
jgi:hypothetical protein